MVIKHIVLSGGGYLGLYELGVLQYLHDKNFYTHKNLKSIYGTSIGSLISAIICLNVPWEDIIQYFEKRPWHKLMQITPTMVINVIHNKGLFDENIIKNILLPFLKSNNLQENITLLEFYNKTHIELYIYTIDVNNYTSIELSYKSFPDLSLIHAIYMSCCIPYIFQPFWLNNNYYIDGGLINNYPIVNCLNRIKDTTNVEMDMNIPNDICVSKNIDMNANVVLDTSYNANTNIVVDNSSNTTIINSTLLTDEILGDEILGIRFDTIQSTDGLKNNTNIFEYGYFLTKKIINSFSKNCRTNYPHIKHEIVISCIEQNMNDVQDVLNSTDKRKEFITYGNTCAKIFLSSL